MRRSNPRPVLMLLLCLAALGVVPGALGQDAAALRARHAELRGQLASNAFGRALVLESTQEGDTFKGEIHAVVAQPFGRVGPALQDVRHWCDILILHLNVKYCRVRGPGDSPVLDVALGRKFDQPLDEAYPLAFVWKPPVSASDYLAVQFQSDAGPLGTRDYRIALEAAPIDEQNSFVHLSYSYRYGLTARLALQGYLATLGRDKVGFSLSGRQADGAPVYIGGVRGVVERNTMRYYLAIEAYLATAGLPPAEQPERRLREWFDATERYPRQLHELTREEYLAMKRQEMTRQQSVLIRAN